MTETTAIPPQSAAQLQAAEAKTQHAAAQAAEQAHGRELTVALAAVDEAQRASLAAAAEKLGAAVIARLQAKEAAAVAADRLAASKEATLAAAAKLAEAESGCQLEAAEAALFALTTIRAATLAFGQQVIARGQELLDSLADAEALVDKENRLLSNLGGRPLKPASEPGFKLVYLPRKKNEAKAAVDAAATMASALAWLAAAPLREAEAKAREAERKRGRDEALKAERLAGVHGPEAKAEQEEQDRRSLRDWYRGGHGVRVGPAEDREVLLRSGVNILDGGR